MKVSIVAGPAVVSEVEVGDMDSLTPVPHPTIKNISTTVNIIELIAKNFLKANIILNIPPDC
jgi:hypothetical protein